MLMLILKQFEDHLVLMLLGAAVISFILAFFEEDDNLSAFVEPAVILVILILNATVGVIQEANAEAAIEKLKESEASEATVVRNGRTFTIPAADVVPGDIIVIADGDKVPADCRVVEITGSALYADEAALTGESEAVGKQSTPVKIAGALNQDKKNCLFSGTLIVRGKAFAIVTATGSQTELGAIAADLTGDEDEEEPKTPLQRKLDEFGAQLSNVIVVICILVWAVNFNHFFDPAHASWVRGAIYYFKIAVSLAVAAIPEGLPAVVTTCLALGTKKMAKNGAIVRSLPSVETLGCTTVICSDKTGTLTTNKMSVHKVVIAASASKSSSSKSKPSDALRSAIFSVTGDSWSPYGAITEAADEDVQFVYPGVDVPALGQLACIASLCSDATLTAERDESGDVVFGKTGAPTEAALLVLAEKIGVPDQAAQDAAAALSPEDRVRAVYEFWRSRYVVENTLEFDRDRKSMSVIARDLARGERTLFVKGAAERILERCSYVMVEDGVQPLTSDARALLEDQLDRLNAQGLRSLGMAYRQSPPTADDVDLSDASLYPSIESGMVFVGMAGMMDPPRAPVKQALEQCAQAGIRVIVITGDNKLTAEAICRRIGLFQEGQDTASLSFTGAELSSMSTDEASLAIRRAVLFSRVEPRHKLQIVEELKRQGETVAMTGDGVNDATALRRADIGIAMGSGTSVAKEASEMVLQDDNFATIVMAVQEGRTIFANTKQFIRYLISSNIGEVACIFGTAMLGIPDALIPVQLLWVNLVTDGLPATALGFNPADPDAMRSKPRSSDESIINGFMFFRYLAIGLYVGLGTIGGFIWWYLYSSTGPHISYWQLTHFNKCGLGVPEFAGVDCSIFTNPIPSTISLSILVTIEMFNAYNALSENQSLLVVSPFSNLWVTAAAALSFALHFLILYTPALASIFSTAPLTWDHWVIVLVASLPIFLLDEILKLIARIKASSEEKQRVLLHKKLN